MIKAAVNETSKPPFRVLVVDDDAAIRATYRHILQPPPSEVGGLEVLISGVAEVNGQEGLFQVSLAEQGETAASLQQAALARGERFQLAFIDMRMPPGWDGLRTAVTLRAQDPSIYIVIATAFSDYDVNELQRALGHDVVMLRKPFNQEEVFQLARTLCQSWETRQRLEAVTADMEGRVLARTAELNRRNTLQAVLVEIANRFVEAGEEDEIDDAVQWCLARLGRSLDVDGCALYQFDSARDAYRLCYEWHPMGVEPLAESLRVISRADLGPVHARFLRGEDFSFLGLSMLPAEMVLLRQRLIGQYESVLATPMETDGHLFGFFSIGFMHEHTAWDADLAKLLLAVGHTITRAMEARAASRNLRESQTRFHNLVQNIPGMVYRCALDANWTIQFMSDYIETLSGYPASDFAGNCVRSFASIIHPDDVVRVDQEVRAAVARHAPYGLNYRIVHADGSVRWVNEHGQASFTANGEVRWLEGVITDVTEQHEAELQIHKLAYFDPLTALPNRRLCMDRLSQALIASKRSQSFGAVLMLDLDYFKRLNDSRGHAVGDQLLIEVAQRLSGNVRQQDTVSRLGGDEYVLILEELGEDEESAARQAEMVAEKIRQALAQPYRLSAAESSYLCSASIGMTLFRGLDATPDILLKQADMALYQAKDAGRNAVRFFNPAVQTAIELRTSIDEALRQSLLQNEFALLYQPQVDRNGALLGAESLLRWIRPGEEPVLPANFLQIAEETGAILPISQWVLLTACEQLKRWAGDPATQALTLAINISARQFNQPDFAEQIRTGLARAGANPARLRLELRENLMLDNIELTVSRMQELKALGVGFAIDGFGAGYASLTVLRRLPLDQVKIDASFIHELFNDPNAAVLVRALLAMSMSLGLEVVADGVETPAQHEFLRANGCTVFQGDLFGKPAPMSEWRL
jgi:diguanylate cyclase (GGDEF)-like protein/PAS domain S-box-containing protein